MTSSFLCPTRSGRTVAASIEGNVQDTIQLKEITINAGSTVEGLIFLSNKSLSKVTKQGQTKGCQIVVALEGFESTVVAFPARHDDSDFLYTSSFLSETTSESYSFLKKIEDEVLGFKKENVRTFVLAAGIMYGKGENILNSHFKRAWL